MHMLIYSLVNLTKEEKNCIQQFFSAYQDARERVPMHQPGTCEWVVNHRDFVQWTETGTPKSLWIGGNPGMGRTVLSRYLIEQFETDDSYNKVLYYFLSYQEENRRSAILLVKSLIHQFL